MITVDQFIDSKTRIANGERPHTLALRNSSTIALCASTG
jgi:hypothetical protein